MFRSMGVRLRDSLHFCITVSALICIMFVDIIILYYFFFIYSVSHRYVPAHHYCIHHTNTRYVYDTVSVWFGL